MRLLNCTKEEAVNVIESDKRIDRGERVEFDLSPEKEKLAKKMANTHERKKPIALDTKPRQRKENATKAELVNALADFLKKQGMDNVTITNKERMIAFSIGADNFEITLIQKRKAKG